MCRPGLFNVNTGTLMYELRCFVCFRRLNQCIQRRCTYAAPLDEDRTGFCLPSQVLIKRENVFRVRQTGNKKPYYRVDLYVCNMFEQGGCNFLLFATKGNEAVL